MQDGSLTDPFFFVWALFQLFLGSACLVAAYACSRLAQQPYYRSFLRYTTLGVQTFSLIGLVWIAGAITNSLGTIFLLDGNQSKAVLAATTVGAAALWALWQARRWRQSRAARAMDQPQITGTR